MPNRAGFNRLAWDARATGIESFPGMILWGAGTNGPAVPPGRYSVRLTLDSIVRTAPLVVQRNPRLTDVTDADLRAQWAFSRKVRDRTNDAQRGVISIRRVKAQTEQRTKANKDSMLAAAAARLTTSASAVEEKIYQVRNRSGQDPLNFPIRVNNRLANLLSMAERGDGAPNANLGEIYSILSTELAGYERELALVWSRDLAAVNRELGRLGMVPVDPECARAEGCAAKP